MSQPRATADQVEAVYSTDADLTPHLLYAHLIVERNLLNCGYDEEMLTQIEIWLAAHSAAIASTGGTSGAIVSEKEGQLSRTYQQPSGEWLGATGFGAQAIALDSCGVLATLGKRRASWRVV